MKNDTLYLDDLIRAYLRFKEWMDYDAERSAYCAKEIIVMQKLFGTAYVTVPAGLDTASHEELLSIMDKRISDMQTLTGAIDELADESVTGELLRVVDKTSLKSSVHYFTPLFQALWQGIRSAGFDVESGQEMWTVDKEPVENHFEDVDEDSFEEIRDFIISEHPKIKLMSFPRASAYALGLPVHIPASPPDIFH